MYTKKEKVITYERLCSNIKFINSKKHGSHNSANVLFKS